MRHLSAFRIEFAMRPRGALWRIRIATSEADASLHRKPLVCATVLTAHSTSGILPPPASPRHSEAFPMTRSPEQRELVREAKAIVALAFRNGPIEDVHSGKDCPTCHGKA